MEFKNKIKFVEISAFWYLNHYLYGVIQSHQLKQINQTAIKTTIKISAQRIHFALMTATFVLIGSCRLNFASAAAAAASERLVRCLRGYRLWFYVSIPITHTLNEYVHTYTVLPEPWWSKKWSCVNQTIGQTPPSPLHWPPARRPPPSLDSSICGRKHPGDFTNCWRERAECSISEIINAHDWRGTRELSREKKGVVGS